MDTILHRLSNPVKPFNAIGGRITDEDRIKRYVEATSAFSSREAGRLIGVSHQTYTDWKGGRYPKVLQPKTRRQVDAFLAAIPPGGSAALDRMVALFAAERLEELARRLREGALRNQTDKPVKISESIRMDSSDVGQK